MEGWINSTTGWMEEYATAINITLLFCIAVLLALTLLLTLIRAAQSGEIIREIKSIQGSVSTLQSVIERDIYKIREYTSQTAINTKDETENDDST